MLRYPVKITLLFWRYQTASQPSVLWRKRMSLWPSRLTSPVPATAHCVGTDAMLTLRESSTLVPDMCQVISSPVVVLCQKRLGRSVGSGAPVVTKTPSLLTAAAGD